MGSTAAGYDWKDLTCMGGDELRALEAFELASLLADALEAGHDEAAERATYYLDTKRFGETAAVAMSQARDAAQDGNFSTAQHLEAIESVIANSAGGLRGSRLSVWELAKFARKTSRVVVFDTCDLLTLISAAERATRP
jgi:hypothetical protein